MELDRIFLPSVEEQRRQLRNMEIRANEFYRILHIGRYAFGKTDIVNRMLQALINLGHTVFDFNTDDFREVIYNPDKHTGGFGPVEIKLEKIKPILEQFQPQIIICNAGGYTFSEEDSNWLKEQGYILVGITLSDPDVFPSTKKFAHRFDYHCTNAIEALKMYKDAGINNTIHFPFAIDRSFVEAEALERPDWTADVICIGNATNRPERNTTMKYLSKYFNVKVYGTGWEIPGSFSVSGEDFFSAARAGKFHVNFPGTRAGFTNVKIGVFESIANGGILCTEYFDEMKHFFEYDKEIIGYKNAEDLKEKIDYYLNHPEEAETIRRRAFHKLIANHLWERRWEELFELIKNDINVERKRLPTKRYEQIKELVGTKERAAKVIVQGYYGARNTGDDLILESISTNIKKRHPNTFIMVAGFYRDVITLKQGFYSLPRTDPYKMDRYIKGADLLIYGGGGLLNDYTFNNSAGVPDMFNNFTHGLAGMSIIPIMASIHDIPRMYFALGAGPLTNPEAQQFARFMINQMDYVTVRDRYSKELLESIEGISKEIIQTADPTYLLEDPGDTLAKEYLRKYNIENHKIISVSLRDWKENPYNFEEKMAKYLDQILENDSYYIIFLPYQFASGKSDDNQIHLRVQNLMKNKSKSHIYEHDGDYQEFLSIVKNSYLVISMRLHGSILANLFGVPSIGFSYDDKVLGHYQEFNTEKYLLGLNFDYNKALELFYDLIKNREKISTDIQKQVVKKKEESAKTFDYALELLKKGLQKEKKIYKYYPREEPLHYFNEKEVLKELSLLKTENENLKSDLKAAERSLAKGKVKEFRRLDLSKVTFECQDKQMTNEIVTRLDKNRIGIRLSDLDAPKKGDFSAAKLDIQLDNKNKHMMIVYVHSPYYKPKNKGRIKYEIRIDGKTVYKEDIAKDGNEKVLCFKVKPKKEMLTLEFRLEALRDCENWSWGIASKTEFYNVSIAEISE